MAGKKRTAIRHNITAPREKSKYLEEVCDSEQLAEIKKWMAKGAVFVVLGSDYSYTKEFYKGLHQLMYSPVHNGACVYDSHYKFQNAFDRPYIMIGLNDACNGSRIDNMKLLNRYRNKTVYTYRYPETEEPRMLQKLPMDVIGMFVNVKHEAEPDAVHPEQCAYKGGVMYPSTFYNQQFLRWALWMPSLSRDVWDSNQFVQDAVDYTRCFTADSRHFTVIDNYTLDPAYIAEHYWIDEFMCEAYRFFRTMQINYTSLVNSWDTYLNHMKKLKHVWDKLDDSYKRLSNLFMRDIWTRPIDTSHGMTPILKALIDSRDRDIYSDENVDITQELDGIFNIEVVE